jgi:type I restriction enzyme R subunit
VSKDSSLCIIDNCQVLRKRKKTMGRKKGKWIFPRYHQLTSVKQILKHTKQNGIGHKYLINIQQVQANLNLSLGWHINSWIIRYDGENNLFNSVIVVTDRTV